MDGGNFLEGFMNNGNGQKSGRNIALVVDDEEQTRKALSMFLKIFGYKVHAYDTVMDAKRFIESHGPIPSIAFVDFSFAGEDGTEIISSLRDYLPIVPIVSVSGYGVRDFFDPLLTPDMYIGKEFNKETLRMALEKGAKMLEARRGYLMRISCNGNELSEREVNARRLEVIRAGLYQGKNELRYDKAA